MFQHLQISVKISSAKNLKKMFFAKKKVKIFAKFCNLLAEICQICSREDDFLVDFEKCCKMRIWTRKSASIQPRTSLRKSAVIRDAEAAAQREKDRKARVAASLSRIAEVAAELLADAAEALGRRSPPRGPRKFY